MAIIKKNDDGTKKVNWLGLVIEVVKAVIAFLAGTQVGV